MNAQQVTGPFLVGLLLVFQACVAPTPAGHPGAVTFVIEFGEEADWVEEHLAESADVLVGLMDSPDFAPPRDIRITLKKDPEGEHGGWASSDAIGYTGDRFPKDAP